MVLHKNLVKYSDKQAGDMEAWLLCCLCRQKLVLCNKIHIIFCNIEVIVFLTKV